MPQPLAAAKPVSLEDLWESQPTGLKTATFDPTTLDSLPPLAWRYLSWAIAPDTPLASAVRLQMHGTIKLGNQWLSNINYFGGRGGDPLAAGHGLAGHHLDAGATHLWGRSPSG